MTKKVGRGDSGLEFPIYLEFDIDSYKEEPGGTYVKRQADDISIKLYNYMRDVISTEGIRSTDVLGEYIIDSDTMSALGIEIYLGETKVFNAKTIPNTTGDGVRFNDGSIILLDEGIITGYI